MADQRLVVSCPSDTSGGTDVLTVLGGKSSCRRKFAMAVHLVDAAGTLVPRDLVLHAAVVYHHDHSLVLRGEKAAESPVFTTFNGIEYPATDKPTRMIAGRAAFKLALSLLSSKCDNSLFAIQFSAQYAPGAEQLLPLPQAAYSGPIRSISRKRNRVPGAGGGHPGYLAGSLLDELPILRSPASGFEQEQSSSPRKKLKPEEEDEDEEDPDVPGQRGSSPALPLEGASAASSGGADPPKQTHAEAPMSSAPPAAGHPTAQDSILGARFQALHPAPLHPGPAATPTGDTPRSAGGPPVTFADLASMLTQAGAFAPAALRLPAGDPSSPSLGAGPSSGSLPGMSGERDGLASPMTPLTLDALNQASAMAAAAKMAAVIGRALEGGGHGGEGASAAEMEQRSLDEEERTLQYMEASLAEVTLELLRRREELSVRRRRYLDHEQRTSVARQSRLMWACPPTGH